MSRREDEHDPLTCEDIDCEFCDDEEFTDDYGASTWVYPEEEGETQEDEE